MSTRRSFLKSVPACGLAGLGLRPVTAEETKIASDIVQFSDNIEPLVRLIEDTSRDKLIEEIARRVQSGLSYQKLLAALLLAGVRNVQPRPAVGFKFHAVLVVNSAHIASVASRNEDRWLPIFWALDNFKGSQAQDVREGNWTMAPVNETLVPDSRTARGQFTEAMDQWDEEKADVAIAGLCRSAGANEIFELFARYGIRDFRSIGHKAIFVANSYRTLQTIGWQHAEPVLRSLTYALQNHEGQPNPATSDLDADRSWRRNQERATKIRKFWTTGKLDDNATRDLLGTLRTGTADDASDQVVELLNAEISPQSIYDALFLAAGELLMRQPGIVALHAMTTTNAFWFAYRMAADDTTRKLVLLQNAAFITMFRDAMAGRGNVNDRSILALEAGDKQSASVEEIFQLIGNDTPKAAEQALAFLANTDSAERMIEQARHLVFLKGNDSHDYKFSSAVLEDFYHISPQWRNRYLASSVFNLRGAAARDNGIVDRIRSAFA
ncbi:MAG: hypothetical protein KDB27_20030 [Planctomycetales bacterium]|nr:hypothetical protein [Planctomycetales bacterium]